ncbi:sigma factor-like helix-turn-helix DNA-binding protein [Amycolatopsis sp. NPDC049691]|uniref:sigma factor-like helix-turn-helix DNA-binding protein n=1 Tax=Amycolatopsis sp. NPDC049691 TaxID=3155155 RepID=UPI0034171BD7
MEDRAGSRSARRAVASGFRHGGVAHIVARHPVRRRSRLGRAARLRAAPNSRARTTVSCSPRPSAISRGARARSSRCGFTGEFTQSEIAERAGVSEMQISRLLAKSLTELRHHIAG